MGHDAHRADPFLRGDGAGRGGDLDRVFRPQPCRRRPVKCCSILAAAALAALLTACGSDPAPPDYGPNPKIPDRQIPLLPNMKIAEPAEWGDLRPTVPEGYTVTAIATDLGIPRQTLVLPNGDILVAEGRGGGAPALRPKD